MSAWKDPDLHRRLLKPDDARDYVEEFPWNAHGFPEGKPKSFVSNGKRYRTYFYDDNDAVSCALALLLDFEMDLAFQEKLREKFEQ